MRTGQRAVVPTYTSVFKGHGRGYAGRFSTKHGLGRTPDLFPVYVEGYQLFLRWLTLDELRASHKPYRPSVCGRTPLPPWVTKPAFNDFTLDGGLSVSIQGIRGHLIALVGLDPVEQSFTDWGTVRYTLQFIETSEARTRLKPMFVKIPP